MPSDETEQDRLDMVHHIALMLLGGELCMTKFTGDPKNVLDSGCGTGIWALDFGDQHPASNVLGVDLMPIQPTWYVKVSREDVEELLIIWRRDRTYPNVHFETDDLTKDWTFEKVCSLQRLNVPIPYPNPFSQSSFDFIHCRHITTGIKSWRHFASQVFNHLTPGGCFELVGMSSLPTPFTFVHTPLTWQRAQLQTRQLRRRQHPIHVCNSKIQRPHLLRPPEGWY